jgi:hypothetical protein
MYVTLQVEKKKKHSRFLFGSFISKKSPTCFAPSLVSKAMWQVRIIVIIRLLLSHACLVALVAGCSTLPKNKAQKKKDRVIA